MLPHPESRDRININRIKFFLLSINIVLAS